MKIGAIPENIMERLVLMSGLAPTPLVDTQVSFLMARTIMTAVKAQIFESLANESRTADDVSSFCKTDSHATQKLLNTLVHLGYLKFSNGKYSLTSLSAKWMIKSGKSSLYNKMLFHFVEWDLAQHYDTYLKTGEAIDIHESFTTGQWALYQNAMEELGRIASGEVVRSTPIHRNATRMLDVGGAQGYYAEALCGKHKQLEATILDLPQALLHVKVKSDHPKINFVEGDIRFYDLGENEWDVIFMANLIHHFGEETNRMIVNRIAKALRKGGAYIVLDFLRDDHPKKGDHLGALMSLYFSVTSRGGTFSLNKIQTWQKEAGLTVKKPIWLRTIPHYGQQIAIK